MQTIAGYRTIAEAEAALVNDHKKVEEQLLRHLDAMADPAAGMDGRWLSIARTHFEQGFMAINRAVFQPTRIALPGDQPVVAGEFSGSKQRSA